MQPISRQTVVERRQPTLRWAAVFAGSIVAVAGWLVLQLFGSGVALLALENRGGIRIQQFGIGSSAWSVIALLIAAFTGGLLAGRLAGQHDRRVAGLHGLLVWATTTIVGVMVVSSTVSAMAPALAVRDLVSTTPAGSAMLVASLGLVFGAIAAIGGALAAAARMREHRRAVHTTAPYPIAEPPAE